MKRFLLVSTLCITCLMGSVNRAHAQSPGYGYGYYSPYGGVHYNFVLPSAGYQTYSPYYSAGSSYPTLLNPNYVVGNNGVLIVPYKSPNIYARRSYEYKPYYPR